MPWHWPRSSLHDVQSGGNPLSLNVMGVHHSIVQGEVIELVHVRFSQTTVSDPVRMDILHSGEFPMPEDLKKHISALESRGATSLRQVDAINKLVAASTVSAIKQFAKQQRFSLDDDVDLIGSSGLLVSNEADDPPDDLPADNDPLTDKNDNDSTELGDLSIIAAKTTKTTIGTFRDSALASRPPARFGLVHFRHRAGRRFSRRKRSGHHRRLRQAASERCVRHFRRLRRETAELFGQGRERAYGDGRARAVGRQFLRGAQEGRQVLGRVSGRCGWAYEAGGCVL